MLKNEFYFKSKKDSLDIHVYKFEPVYINPIGVVQISHGMAETAIRYEYFAKQLTKHGYIVYINDHRGHGITARTPDKVGYLSEKDGFLYLVDDMNTLSEIIKKENPNLPLFLLGHSLGSFASQMYIMKYADNIDGLILSGSGSKSRLILKIGEKIVAFKTKKHGILYKSKIINNLFFLNNNKKIKSPRTNFDWLTRDEEEVDKYINDPFCGVLFPCGFFYDLIKGLQAIKDKSCLKRIPIDLPIYILSGSKDPISRNGKEVIKLKKQYIELGIKDVTCTLYDGGRHEMLNEINKDEVIEGIIKWLNSKISVL